jgi:hypothetical protein
VVIVFIERCVSFTVPFADWAGATSPDSAAGMDGGLSLEMASAPWRIVRASVIGSSHIQAGTPCQDYSLHELIDCVASEPVLRSRSIELRTIHSQIVAARQHMRPHVEAAYGRYLQATADFDTAKS